MAHLNRANSMRLPIGTRMMPSKGKPANFYLIDIIKKIKTSANCFSSKIASFFLSEKNNS
jgi:hypothetical protein